MRFILFAFILSVSLACEQFADCTDEQSAIALFNQMESFDISVISAAVQHSWWELGAMAIESGLKQSVDVSSAFEKAVREKNIQLRKLESYYKANTRKVSVIAPTYQWADGLEEVALNIKLAHKWDAPATLECDDIKVDFQDSSMVFEANCTSTGKSFRLNLQFNDQIVPEKCTWSKAAVSRVVVNIQKKERKYWENILGKGLRPPRNAHPWYSMQEQIKKKDEETLYQESVAKRLEERRIAKERREREERLMEERRRKK